ncbi:P-loop containing nucleoside triphosphate hydrolase protein [Mycena rosella]|uniref:RNA helicase n=1 Tax=Mycena rosella TaxID=1033263 RepID=A0AAD7DNM8_MYCRO|nr:P-loop containing nucleoside triphosphate hydrolase protein [Mycena rosella]
MLPSKPKKIRLFGSPAKVKSPQLKRKAIPTWVDVSDEEDRKQRRRQSGGGKQKHQQQPQAQSTPQHPQKQHSQISHPQAHSTPPRKKARLSGPTAPIQEQRRLLPIARGRDALVQEIRANEVTVLLGETGSGKTTQVPQYLLESGLAGAAGLIGITQPRKVAAIALAARVSAEQGTPLGGRVGYAVRFDERAGPATRIKYMTDGMLARELLGDALLSRYAVIVVDEAHERTLRTDLLLANLKRILRERNGDGKGKGKEKAANPLKVVIMSATLDAEKFSRFFSNAKIIYVKGRQHPVKIFHSVQGQTDYVDAALRTFFQIHVDQPPGDVLIFLPGQEDIESLEQAVALFARQLPAGHAEVSCAHVRRAPGRADAEDLRLGTAQRAEVHSRDQHRRDVHHHPRCPVCHRHGKSKEKRYLAGSSGGGFDTLLTRDITKSNAMQRAGRAGREGPGFCYRLYTEDAFRTMAPAPSPRSCAAASRGACSSCSASGRHAGARADGRARHRRRLLRLRTLFLLGALDSERAITKLGRAMAAFPLEPAHARALLASKDLACTAEVLDVVSVLAASGGLFVDAAAQRTGIAEARRKFVHPSGDHLTVLNVVRAYAAVGNENDTREEAEEREREREGAEEKVGRSVRKEWARAHFVNERTLREARAIRTQLVVVCRREGLDPRASCGEREEPVLLSLAHGLAQNAALIAPDGSYKQIIGQTVVKIHPSSVMADKKVPAIIYNELVYTNQIYARGVSSIPKSFFASLGAFNRREA